MRIALAISVVVLAGSVLLFALGGEERWVPRTVPEQKDREARQTILEILQEDGRFKILLGAIGRTDFEKSLNSSGNFTFFAPMDEAFEKVPKLADLLADGKRLDRVLERHLLPEQALDTEALGKQHALQPKQGESITVKAKEKYILLNDAKILIRDLRATNGIVHGLDRVLMKDNDSLLREAGETIERGLKEGVEKIEDTFDPDAPTPKERERLISK